MTENGEKSSETITLLLLLSFVVVVEVAAATPPPLALVLCMRVFAWVKFTAVCVCVSICFLNISLDVWVYIWKRYTRICSHFRNRRARVTWMHGFVVFPLLLLFFSVFHSFTMSPPWSLYLPLSPPVSLCVCATLSPSAFCHFDGIPFMFYSFYKLSLKIQVRDFMARQKVCEKGRAKSGNNWIIREEQRKILHAK